MLTSLATSVLPIFHTANVINNNLASGPMVRQGKYGARTRACYLRGLSGRIRGSKPTKNESYRRNHRWTEDGNRDLVTRFLRSYGHCPLRSPRRLSSDPSGRNSPEVAAGYLRVIAKGNWSLASVSRPEVHEDRFLPRRVAEPAERAVLGGEVE